MDRLTKDDLMQLIDHEAAWCVSMYMPAFRAGPEVQQNAIRFRNLLRTAADHLERLDMRAQEIAALLEPAYALRDDPAIWREAGDGLAVFVAPDVLYYYHLPLHFDEWAVVKPRFYIKPLLPLLSGDGEFYVLALSQKRIRLLEGTRDSVQEVPVSGVPESLNAALRLETTERQQLRAVGGSGQGAVFQGHGESRDTEEKQLLRYFQKVDRGLRELLAERTIPLVLAGVERLLPIYREANSYPHLLETGLTINPDALANRELHERAWGVVGPRFATTQAEQVALFEKLSGRSDPRATTSLKPIVLGAHQGRVATLFVALGVQQWGAYDPDSITLHVHPERQPGDQDLLDLAAAQTFTNGGVVYAVDPAAVPGEAEMAAIMRY